MERRAPFVLAWILFLVCTSVGQDDVVRIKGRVAPAAIQDPTRSSVAPAKNRASSSSSAQKTQALANYSRLPLSFEPNRGQAPDAVRFLSRGSGYNLLLTSTEALLALDKARSRPQHIGTDGNKATPEASAPLDWLRVRFETPRPGIAISGEDQLPGKSNYFIGNDPHKWRSGIANYARVRYHQIYPGIDLDYYGNQGQLEYDFIVAPGARPEQIGLLIDGGGKLELSAGGDLLVRVGGNTIRLQKPRLYQEITGTRREVAGGYALQNGRVKFRVGDYDHHQPLIIDPVLSFSSFFGGSGDELFILNNIDGAIAVDSNGNIYVAGETQSASFAFPGFPPGGNKSTCGTDSACNVSTGGSDVFIAKLNPAGSAVLAFTYVGGSGRDILALSSTSGGLVVDGTGVYISGTSFSSDFPTTSGVFRPNCTNAPACTSGGDGFVTKLDVNLASLIFSTYLSGTGTAQAGQMQVDSQGNVYVIGQAESGYPAVGTLTPCSPASTCVTGFVTELNNTGTGQVFSDFLGGSGQDYVDAVALDSSNNIYVLGSTTSADFPAQKTLLPAVTSGGVYSSTNGTVWTALNSGLTGLNIQGLAVSPTNGQVLIAGTTQGVFQTITGGTSWTQVFAANGTAIAFDPLNPQTVYAGTGDGVNGLLKSTNGGSTWSSTTLPSYFMNAVAVDPINEGTLYVGTQGGGVWKSTNGGTSWTQIQTSSGLAGVLINSIVIDYTNSAIVYVGSADQGIFVSTNGGGNWSPANNGLVASNTGNTATVRTLAIDPNTHTTLYAGTNSGVFKSTNGAGTWTLASNGLSQGIATIAVRTIAVDPANSQNVYAGSGSAGLFFSSNGGGTWSLLNNLGPHGITALALFHAAPSPTTVYAGSSYAFAFAAKINSGGGSLAYATLLGGNSPTYLWGIALDSSNNAYVAGQTYASNFPVSGSAFQKTLLGNTNGVVAKLNSSGNALSYASYLAGSGSDAVYAIAVDGNQQAWLTGITSSNDFPLANGIWLQSPGNGGSDEGFVTQFNATGTGLVFSTYLGGEGNCQNCNGPVNSGGVDLTLDSSGNAYVIGFTNDNSFVTANALQPAIGGGYDAFIAEISAATTTTDLSICFVDSSGQCTTTPPAAVPAGGDIVLNLQVTNNSTTTPATGVVVGGRGGNGLNAIACTVSVGICQTSNPSIIIPNGGFASLGTLAAGASAQISVTLVGTQPGSSVVTVDVRENETDSNPANNTASTTLTFLPGADLSVDMNVVASPSPAQVGSTLTYTANITNLGPSNASNVVAVFSLSPSTAATFGTLPAGCTSTAAGTLTCTIGPLAAGASAPSLTTTATVVSLPLTATIVVSNSPEADPDPVNNSLSITTGVSAAGANNAELNGQYAFVARGFLPITVLFSNVSTTVPAGSGAIEGASPGPYLADAFEFSPATTGTFTDARIDLWTSAADGAVTAALYSDAGGTPGTLLAQLTTTTAPFFSSLPVVSFSANNTSFTQTSGPAVTLTAGSQYWLVLTPGDTTSSLFYAIGGATAQVPQAQQSAQNGAWTSTGPANVQVEIDGTPSSPTGEAIVIGGSFTADGAGHITGGVKDVNISGVTADASIIPASSSYSVGADNRGQLTLASGSSTHTWDFSLGSISAGVASLGHMIGRGTTTATIGSAISGVFEKQDPTAFTLAALNGDWAFLDEGTDSSGGRFASAGRFTLSAGNITNGSEDFNDNGVFDNGTTTASVLTGSLASLGTPLDTTNGRFVLTAGSGTTPGHSAVYVVSANEALFMSIDPISANPLGSGSALRQNTTFCPTTGNCAFNNTALSGNSVLYIQGNSSSVAGGSRVQVGALTFTPVSPPGAIGSITGGLDENDGGTISTPSGNTVSASYSVASNGRVTITGGGGHSPYIYLVNQNQAFLVGSDSSTTQAGTAEPQVGPIAFTTGLLALGTQAPAVSGTGVGDLVETFAATSNTTAVSTNNVGDTNSIASGLFESAVLTNFEVNALDQTTGRFTFLSGGSGDSARVGYFVNSGRQIIINANSDTTTPNIIISDNQSVTSGALTNLTATIAANPAAGVYAGGAITYTIVVSNASSTAATSVVLATAFSPSLTINSITPSQGTCAAAGLPATLGSFSCALGTVTQGTPVTVVVAAVAPASGNTCGSSNLGCITASASVGEATPATVTTPILAQGTTSCTGTTTNWVGGTGNWSDAAMWSTGVVPNSTSVNVCIANGNPVASQVTLDISASVANLYIDSDASLIIGNGNTLTPVAGTISNAGTITIAAGANNTFLSINGAVTLTGSGTLTLSTSGGGTAYINEACNCSAALTNVNNTIQGVGVIGNNGLPFTNQAGGTVNANGAGTLEINSGGVTNLGTMEATGGGTLQLNSTTVTNASGTITSTGSGSNVQFVSATVQGGTLTTSGGGVLGAPNGSTATLDGSTASGQVTISGTYTTADASTTVLAGTINNTGTILVSSVADNTQLRMSGPVTLTGGGTLTLSTTGSGSPVINENCNWQRLSDQR